MNDSYDAPSVALFVDMTKAFDTVHHKKLLEKLEGAGVRGTQLMWMESFLTSRTQRVRLGRTLSDPLSCEFGVPQGSVLGPFLFLVYINDLLLSDLSGAVTAYADDVALLYTGSSQDELYARLQSDLFTIRSWLDDNGMVMSAKTVYMEFGRESGDRDLACHSVGCGGGIGACDASCLPISRVSSFKYLGLTLDSAVNWKQHLDVLRTGLRFANRQIYALRSCCSPKLMRMFYRALIESRLRYGLALWGGCYSSHLKPVVVAQKSIIRTMSFAGRRDHTRPLFHEWTILPVRHLYVYKVTDIFFKRSGGTCDCLISVTTRRGENFYVPAPTNERFKKTLNFCAPMILNNLKRVVDPLVRSRVVEWLQAAPIEAIEEVITSRYSA
ncbi:hypothetical protein DMENIID0001_165160 [Sergentomyia squamirostris]